MFSSSYTTTQLSVSFSASNTVVTIQSNVALNASFSISQASLAIIGGDFSNHGNLSISANSSAIIEGDIDNSANITITESSSVCVEGNFNNLGQFNLSESSAASVQGNVNNNASISLTSPNSLVSVKGNFSQPQEGLISFGLSLSENAKMNISGNAAISGTIQLNLTAQLPSGTSMTFILINFGSSISRRVSVIPNITNSQIQVVPSYKGSSCDSINAQAVNHAGSFQVVLTSSVGSKCGGGLSVGAVIGISLGCAAAFGVGLVIVLLLVRRKEERDAIEITKGREMQNLRASAVKGDVREKEWKSSAPFDDAK